MDLPFGVTSPASADRAAGIGAPMTPVGTSSCFHSVSSKWPAAIGAFPHAGTTTKPGAMEGSISSEVGGADLHDSLRGVTRHHFDGAALGPEYLTFKAGQCLHFLRCRDCDDGWAYGALQDPAEPGRTRRGWFPPTYWQAAGEPDRGAPAVDTPTVHAPAADAPKIDDSWGAFLQNRAERRETPRWAGRGHAPEQNKAERTEERGPFRPTAERRGRFFERSLPHNSCAVTHPSTSSRSWREVDDWRAKNGVVAATPHNPDMLVPKPTLNLDEVPFPDWAIDELRLGGCTEPTALQAQAWPIAAVGQDLLVQSRPGGGSVLAYALPVVVRILERPGQGLRAGPEALIVVATQERAARVLKAMAPFARAADLEVKSLDPSRGPELDDSGFGTAIFVATPQRMAQHFGLGRYAGDTGMVLVDLARVTALVVDGFDTMDVGGLEATDHLIAAMPTQHQFLAFSSTSARGAEDFLRAILGGNRARRGQLNTITIEERMLPKAAAPSEPGRMLRPRSCRQTTRASRPVAHFIRMNKFDERVQSRFHELTEDEQQLIIESVGFDLRSMRNPSSVLNGAITKLRRSALKPAYAGHDGASAELLAELEQERQQAEEAREAQRRAEAKCQEMQQELLKARDMAALAHQLLYHQGNAGPSGGAPTAKAGEPPMAPSTLSSCLPGSSERNGTGLGGLLL